MELKVNEMEQAAGGQNKANIESGDSVLPRPFDPILPKPFDPVLPRPFDPILPGPFKP